MLTGISRVVGYSLLSEILGWNKLSKRTYLRWKQFEYHFDDVMDM